MSTRLNLATPRIRHLWGQSRVEQVRRFRLCPTMTPIRWSHSLDAAIVTAGFGVGSTVVLNGQSLVVAAYDSGAPSEFKVAAASLAPSEASVLAKLGGSLAELSAKETLIYEGIVQPLRPIVNDRLEFNGATFNGRAIMPDQATVLDIQDLGDASNPYKFRVFVEITWQTFRTRS